MNDEFEEKLKSAVAKAIAEGGREDFVQHLKKCAAAERQGDPKKAIWIGLQGGNKVVAKALNMTEPPAHQVIAVPYWVAYDPETGNPEILRQDNYQAKVVDAKLVRFFTGRWNSVSETNQIVLDGAIVRAS
ncbi:MAG: hypothetical protein RI935_82 [Candidatus Parcubacteria bacterium]|jgi:hypothetical protein